MKTAAAIEPAGENEKGETLIRVSNTGRTIFETPESALQWGAAGPVKLVAKLYKNGALIEERDLAWLPGPLPPGDAVDVSVEVGDTGEADTLTIELVSDGRFDFSELGMAAIEAPLPG